MSALTLARTRQNLAIISPERAPDCLELRFQLDVLCCIVDGMDKSKFMLPRWDWGRMFAIQLFGARDCSMSAGQMFGSMPICSLRACTWN